MSPITSKTYVSTAERYGNEFELPFNVKNDNMASDYYIKSPTTPKKTAKTTKTAKTETTPEKKRTSKNTSTRKELKMALMNMFRIKIFV